MHTFYVTLGSQVPARHCSSSPLALIPAQLLSCMTRPDRVRWGRCRGLLINPGHSDLIFSHGCGCYQHLHLASACIGLVGLLALAMLVAPANFPLCRHTTHMSMCMCTCAYLRPINLAQSLARTRPCSSSVEQSFPYL